MKYLIAFCLFLISFQISAQGSWQVIAGAPSCGRIDDISFYNDSVGFISVYDSIYKTLNTGNTWSFIGKIDSIYGSRSLEFMNDSIGFSGILMGFGWGGLYRTLDGGNSWAKLNNMQMDSLDGICGMDSEGDLLIAVGTYAGPGKFYKTTDFGATWVTQDLSQLASGLVDCLIIDSLTYLISGISDSSTFNKATILKTTDGGNTWTRVFLASGPMISYLWKLYLLPNGVGFGSIQQGPNSICRTTDFGDTWTEQVVSLTNNDYGGVALYNDTLGWVADQYNNKIWETHDGGLTWTYSYTMIAGNRMVIPDGNTVLASGITIYRYDFNTGIAPANQSNLEIHQLLLNPNPADRIININAAADRRTYGHLDVLSVDGKLVHHHYTGIFETGDNVSSLDVSNLPAGNYVLLWRNNERFISSVFNVMH